MAQQGTARHRGDQAERLALQFLEQQGLTVLSRNVRLGPLEIDVVAREGRTLVLIEIRARSVDSLTSGFSSIGGRKRRFLRHAAERLWKKRYRHDPSLDRVRFDVVSLTLSGEAAALEYVRAAF